MPATIILTTAAAIFSPPGWRLPRARTRTRCRLWTSACGSGRSSPTDTCSGATSRACWDNERAAVYDLKKAATLNPIDPLVAKALANALYARNGKLGRQALVGAEAEAREALEHAIYLDPQDLDLLNAYADQVSDGDPMKAALRQTIQINTPSVQNAVRLGQLATQVALKETDETKKQAFFTVAESAFEQARQAEPANQLMLDSYAEYYRARGQSDKAAQLLAESKDSQLLRRHYFRIGPTD